MLSSRSFRLERQDISKSGLDTLATDSRMSLKRRPPLLFTRLYSSTPINMGITSGASQSMV